MNVLRPSGDVWTIEDAANKLALRAGLPGAFLFDRAANASRNARGLGLSAEDRLSLALPASWLVNSPAISRVLQRWATDPQRDVWLALVETLDVDAGAWRANRSDVDDGEIAEALRALGPEDYVVEAASKVLALLAPDVVPLMPRPARVFVLGEQRASAESSFVAMIDWFTEATTSHALALDALARAHSAVTLSGAQVLDRLLWFDSEGHRHFGVEGRLST